MSGSAVLARCYVVGISEATPHAHMQSGAGERSVSARGKTQSSTVARSTESNTTKVSICQ